MDWGVTYNAGDTSITWSAPSDQAPLRPGLRPPSASPVPSLQCLGIISPSGSTPALFKFYTNSGATSVPGISSVPEPSSVVLAFISMGLAGRFVAMTHPPLVGLWMRAEGVSGPGAFGRSSGDTDNVTPKS